jgi:hypothetical protein
MFVRSTLAIAGAATLSFALSVAGTPPAQALSMKECSVKFQAAKTAGTLNGMNWTQFRKAECGSDEAAAPAAAPAEAPAAAAPTKAAAKPAPTAATGGASIFPTAISPKYANETPGKARMHTCLDQYNANKAGGGNGDLKWIMKGGGYYSECNKRLKS